jgi:menaquinone-9 beta-reductase
MPTHSSYDVIIAGGGPAGASAAIHLAQRGARVLLAEQKKFPRAKLCGEFISPECALHFERLGVADQMSAAHPAPISETVFYARNGRNVAVPSSWFGASGLALGLSRAEMDERLLRRAAEAGADVLEDAQAGSLLFDLDQVTGVTLKHSGTETSYRARVVIDATGRSRGLARRLTEHRAKSQPAAMVAFKVHLEDTRVAPGACEIYFYPGGYGGLSSIENGLSNLCFIAAARDVRASDSNADRVAREIVCQNQRAAYTLKQARVYSPWLAVSLEGFGRYSVAPANGLLTIGDAASFIDPFTGSGMLMALQSGELAAEAIAKFLDRDPELQTTTELRSYYQLSYRKNFNSRLRLCSLMRRLAFAPTLAQIAIRFFGASDHLRQRVSRATRGSRETYSVP